jgi:type IV pilus assembly protein PilM
MGSMNNTQTNFMKDKPVFGLDIGQSTLKVMQCDATHSKPRVVGYGYTEFEPTAIKDGVVTNPEAIAKATLNLFQHRLIGDITTRRVAMAIPSYRSYSRSIQLPKLKPNELEDAVRLEVEQYTPMSIDDLYVDYTLTSRGKTQADLDEYMAVAIPKNIVDSYMDLTRILGLEVVLIETTMGAASRLFSRDAHSDVASVIIDFGTLSCDVSIFRGTVLVTGTVPSGGLVFTRSIAEKLGVSEAEAATIKTRYGLAASKKQAEIIAAISPTLAQLAKEIRRMIRYYEERYGTDHPIGQIIALGGGANMPGLTDHLISELRIPVRTCDPWSYLDAHHMQLPALADHPMYATAAGLSFLNPKEVFRA